MTRAKNWFIGFLSAFTIFLALSFFYPDNAITQVSGVTSYIFQRKPTIFSTTVSGVGTTPVLIYTSNAADRRFLIQNIGIVAMRVSNDSTELANNTGLSFVLSAGTAEKDGLGGVFQDGVFNDALLNGSNLYGRMSSTDSVAVTIWR